MDLVNSETRICRKYAALYFKDFIELFPLKQESQIFEGINILLKDEQDIIRLSLVDILETLIKPDKIDVDYCLNYQEISRADSRIFDYFWRRLLVAGSL